MNKRQFLRFLSGGGVLASASMLSACVVPYAPPPRYSDPRYAGGPGYDYYYYPDVNVYYGIATGYYFYRARNRWIRSRVLPRHYRLRPRYRRSLVVRSPHPYRQNRRHVRRYRLAPGDRRRALRQPRGRRERRLRRDEDRRERALIRRRGGGARRRRGS